MLHGMGLETPAWFKHTGLRMFVLLAHRDAHVYAPIPRP